MSELQLLRDPDIEPTSEIIAEALGSANTIYVGFMDDLKSYDVEVEWRYYNDGKAWLGKGLHKWMGARGGQKEVTVFWLSIWDGFFKTSFFIPEKVRTEVLDLPLGNDVKNRIADAKQMGKLKFFPLVFDLHASEALDDIYMLVSFKKTIK